MINYDQLCMTYKPSQLNRETLERYLILVNLSHVFTEKADVLSICSVLFYNLSSEQAT